MSDSTSEQPAATGSGPLLERRYFMDVQRPRKSPAQLMAVVQADVHSFSPDALANFNKKNGDDGPIKVGDEFHITILGRGGHAAHPEEAVDPIAVGAQVVSNLQHVVSRGVSALDALVVSVTYFQAGTTTNVIPDRAELKGTVRSFDPELRERAPAMIERVLKGVCEAHGARYEYRYENGYRPLINDDGVAEVLRQVALEVVGEERTVVAKPTMGGEDFSAYLEKAPGAYFNVGSRNDDLESGFPHHHLHNERRA